MKNIVTFAAFLAIVAVPATAMAAPGDQRDNARGKDRSAQANERSAQANERSAQAKERSARANERAAQGQERAAQARQRAAERRADRVNGARLCRAEAGETEETRAAFREEYGTNENNANAFGKCVSMEARTAKVERVTEIRQQRRGAARSCHEDLRDMGREDFREEFGNNRNGANAFGRCVSQTVRAESQVA